MLLRSFFRRCVNPVRSSFAARKITDGPYQNNADLLWLQDMNKADFTFVSEKLGKTYMQDAENDTPTFPVEGLIYGYQHGRKCVVLKVSRMKKSVWVPFVLDDGSPNILLGRDALIALGLEPNDVHNTVNINVHGFDCLTAYHEPEDKRWLVHVNLIGWTFFRDTKCFELMDADTRTLRLYRNLKQFRDTL